MDKSGPTYLQSFPTPHQFKCDVICHIECFCSDVARIQLTLSLRHHVIRHFFSHAPTVLCRDNWRKREISDLDTESTVDP